MRRRWPAAALALLALAVVAALAWLGVFPGLRGRYHNSTPALAAAYRAKEMCSCLFVDGRDEPYCHAWTAASPDVARPRVDAGGRSVRARALLFWSARARLDPAAGGCVLE